MAKLVHPLAGAIALLAIAAFWLSTALSELFATPELVIAVKTAIPWGFLILVPALAATGGTGFKLARGRKIGLIGSKMRRMPFIAANGLIVLIPAALFLSHKANAHEFDAGFYAVQAIELIAGATNFTLLMRNMIDGLRLTGKVRSKPA